jgi:RHS repeat-associated protein
MSGPVRSWELGDALGSVRMTLDDTGAALGSVGYDPWGTPQGDLLGAFGFTGELQDGASGLVHVRARWYDPGQSTFTSRDPFAGFPATPYSLHPYQYAYSNPALWTDPTGEAVGAGACVFTGPFAGHCLTGVAVVVGAIILIEGTPVIVEAILEITTYGTSFTFKPTSPQPVPVPGPVPQLAPTAPPVSDTQPAETVPPAPRPEPDPRPDPTRTVDPPPIPVDNECPTPTSAPTPGTPTSTPGTPTPGTPTPTPGNDYRGVIQIQGQDINPKTNPGAVDDTLSWNWSRSAPLRTAEALVELERLYTSLNSSQRKRRDQAYLKAVDFINRAKAAGGVPPKSYSFQNKSLPSKFDEARIDIVINKGVNLVP